MLKKLFAAVLITSMLILPVNSAGPIQPGAGPSLPASSSPDYRPGSVPAETDAVESMSPALHALVLALLNHESSQFDPEDSVLTWEVLYNMLSLYGQLDSRSVTGQGELVLPEETLLDYAAALTLNPDKLGNPPTALQDRLRYDSASRCYTVVCGEDSLAQIQAGGLQPSGGGYTLSGALVYQVDGRALARFQATLVQRDNLFGYAITGIRLTG